MKILKKILSLFIILSLCVIVAVYSDNVVANAATTGDGLEYYIDDGEAFISGYEGEIVNLVIPKEIYGYEVKGIGSEVFEDCDTIETLTISGSLSYIGYEAFYGCTNLEKVVMNGGVQTIGDSAFEECINLKNLKLGEGVEKINERAFYNCQSLVSVTFPESLMEIEGQAFSSCIKIKSINIPKNLTRIGMYRTWISITDIHAPMMAFTGCSGLTQINVSSANETYTSVDGVLFSKDMKTLYMFPQGKGGQYTIPTGVTCIHEGSFNQSTLDTLIIPEGVTTILDSAFLGSGITKLVLPKSISSIGDEVFDYCRNDLVVYCKLGSYALEYALNNDIKVDVDNYLGNFTATICQPSFGYTGDYIKPVVTVKGKVDGKTVTLTNWKDYKVTYKNFKNPGTASITVTGRGKYVGELYLTFTIRPIADLSKFSATIKQPSFAYTGNYIKPVVTVKGKVNGKTVTLENWKHYKITYKNFKNPGQATMTITGRNGYAGTKTITFYIRPSQVKNVKYVGKSTSYVNFKWDKCVGVTGYEVYRSTSKTGTYTKVGTVSATSFKNTGLKSGKTYYYKVRAYKTVGSTKLYGAYSSVYALATSK